jgi:hypothetical protein
MNDENEINIDDITVDLGDTHISGGSGYDTITLNPSNAFDMSYYSTSTLPTTGTNYTISNGTWGTGGIGTITTTPYTTPYITTTTSNPGISVQGDAEFSGNIKVKGKDLSEWMDAIERRLAILVPNPKKLEQYEALQKAYKHYKMLEALCEEQTDNDESK